MSQNWPLADALATNHLEQLAKAHAEHERIREGALRAYQQNELLEQQLRLRREAEAEARRVQIEKENAQLELKLRSLKATKVELPPPPPTPPPAPIPTNKAPTPPPAPVTASVQPPPAIVQVKQPETSLPATRPSPFGQAPVPQTQANPFGTPSQTTAPQLATVHAQKPPEPASAPLKPAATTQAPASRPREASQPQSAFTQPATATGKPAAQHASPYAQLGVKTLLSKVTELQQIHQNLKKLRKYMIDCGKQDPALKKEVGEKRRQIRKSVGQLTEGRGANKVPTQNITSILQSALQTIPSPPADPKIYLLEPPSPVEGALNNNDTLPVFFLYLLNIFAKAIVQQLADEAGVKPGAADPVGLVAVSIFANKNLCWRDKSMIDILICKIRISCPVLFGLRGTERTEEGRARLGWKKEGGGWVPEQLHYARMTGLGAGYAAISLRNFGKSTLKNPFPPYHYWTSIASILNTPGNEISPSQCQVLKAMIENYEQRFLTFYGSAARAVLQIALVDFPARAEAAGIKGPAVAALKVHAEKLNRTFGLQFRPAQLTISF